VGEFYQQQAISPAAASRENQAYSALMAALYNMQNKNEQVKQKAQYKQH